METKNYANGDGIPLGFGMALAQNAKAMEYFSSLSESERQAILSQIHNINSKSEMQSFVAKLAERGI
ncbi:MAG TPA: hypothetical protein PLD48_08690 [Bacillota bacterium]|nr:hypothetical protein [Bacillota bacterium]HOK69376.1 hypothetical protein [Bacillota bacterium]HPP85993.1 hypothetical protein [Bacillota bacterium]